MLHEDKKAAIAVSDDRCSTVAPKFGVVVDDVPYPVPRQKIRVSLLKSQAGVGDGDVLVRDHNSPHDVVLDDQQIINLADGNVFYTLSSCDVQPRGSCDSPAKRAYFVDDSYEVTTNTNQTEVSLKQLFALADQVRLIRDYKSPNDTLIEYAEAVPFEVGPVFITRKVQSKLRITVNHRPFTEEDGVKDRMTGLAIAALVYPEDPRQTKVQLGERVIGSDEEITIGGCESFEVVRCDVKGGYELSRVQREVEILRAGGASITIVETPTPSVVYHNLKTRHGCDPSHTDVLVPIPSGYPSEIDWAYLPQHSPLIGRVQGSPQDHRVEALGATWRQISYHPHRGGGAPPFNPTKHGYHTYLSEVLSWLHKV